MKTVCFTYSASPVLLQLYACAYICTSSLTHWWNSSKRNHFYLRCSAIRRTVLARKVPANDGYAKFIYEKMSMSFGIIPRTMKCVWWVDLLNPLRGGHIIIGCNIHSVSCLLPLFPSSLFSSGFYCISARMLKILSNFPITYVWVHLGNIFKKLELLSKSLQIPLKSAYCTHIV